MLLFLIFFYQYFLLLGKHNENDKNVNNITSSNEPMLPCEFCDGLVPMRKLLEHQVIQYFLN